jgi:anti-sigma factor RsiW
VNLTFRPRALAVIATAAATCIVSACATASSGAPVAASSATAVVATPTGAATAGAGSATADVATPAAATGGAVTVGVPTAGGMTATLVPVTSSPSPAGLPTSGAAIPAGSVTRADNGKTFQLTVGQQITVVLSAPPMWDQPTAQGSALIRVSASGGYPGTTPAQAVFRAAAPGTAQVTSASDMQCLHTTPRCLPAVQIWSISLVVS